METKQDASYGVVPVYPTKDGWEVLLIHQISHRGSLFEFWTLPKGHAEEGETPIETALRELREETGITEVTLDPSQTFTIEYSFIHEEEKVEKTVSFWIGYCDNTDTVISQPQEVKEIRWCDFTTAIALVTHQNSKDVLTKVAEFLATQ